MTFLPIVHRELRVASRKRGTYLSRAVVAGVVILLWLFISLSNTRYMSAAELARMLFWTYGILAMLYGLLAGVLFTADSLSTERRDGTLGLLFLTDLRGFDVVLGKLCATSWHGVYSLLVIVPVLGLPLLMGGVSFAETTRLVAVILSCMFYSLSLGLLVSTLCRRLVTAVAFTFFILFLQCTVPWVVLVVLEEGFGWRAEHNPLIVLWPFTSLTVLQDVRYQGGAVRGGLMHGAAMFWLPIAMSVFLGLISLVSACLWLPRTWRREQEPQSLRRNTTSTSSQRIADQPSLVNRRLASLASLTRQQLLEANPCRWLSLRGRRHNRLLAAALVGLTVLWMLLLSPAIVSGRNRGEEVWFVMAMFGVFVLHVLVKGWMALECGRRFCEDRQSGALELLLVTPIRARDVLDGEWAAIRKTFTRPLILTFGVSLALLLTNLLANPLGMGRELTWFSEIILYGGLILWLDAKAIAYTGMLTGLKATRHHRAVLGTLARVMLPPWIGVLLFFLLIILPGSVDEDGFTFCMRGWFALSAFIDVLLIRYARETLTRNLRALSAGEVPLDGAGMEEAPDESVRAGA